MSQKKLVKLIYYLNHEESTLSFDPYNKLSVLKTLINLTQKINLDNYDILYGKKRISWDEDKPLKSFIGNDSVPVFYFKKKEQMGQSLDSINPGLLQKSYNNNLSKSLGNSRIPSTLGSNGSNKSYNLSNPTKCKVSIDFFPSRTEIYTMLDNFLESNNYSKDYESGNKGTGIEIIFKNSDVAYDFVKFINYEKMANPLYKQIRTNLIFESKSPQKMRLNQSPQIQRQNSLDISDVSIKREHTLQESDYKYSVIPSRVNSESMFKKYNQPRYQQNLRRSSKGRSLDPNSPNYVYNYKSLKSSFPYMAENDQQFEAYLKNKDKWLNKKGIVPVNGKYKPEAIPKGIINYDIPYGKPAINYNFRDYYGTEMVVDESKFLKK